MSRRFIGSNLKSTVGAYEFAPAEKLSLAFAPPPITPGAVPGGGTGAVYGERGRVRGEHANGQASSNDD